MLSPKTLELLNKHKVIVICFFILFFIACFHKKKEITEFFMNIFNETDES